MKQSLPVGIHHLTFLQIHQGDIWLLNWRFPLFRSIYFLKNIKLLSIINHDIINYNMYHLFQQFSWSQVLNRTKNTRHSSNLKHSTFLSTTYPFVLIIEMTLSLNCIFIIALGTELNCFLYKAYVYQCSLHY